MGLGGVVRLFHSSAVVIGDGIQSSLVWNEGRAEVSEINQHHYQEIKQFDVHRSRVA
jgi:hypothetical protein